LIADVAAFVGMRPTCFKTVFKRAVGIPVHQYIIEQRVQRAIALLSAGQPRLIDVAQLSGFSDQSHMARCMRRAVGRTPAQIARRENPTES
jgi:AraC family transcriptional regulator